MPAALPKNPEYAIRRDDPARVVARLAGDWTLAGPAPPTAPLERAVAGAGQDARLVIDGADLGRWDTRLLLFLRQAAALAERRALAFETENLPQGVLDLLRLAAQPGTQSPDGSGGVRPNFLHRLGAWALSFWAACRSMATFIGELALEIPRLLTGRSAFRFRDFLYFVQACGVESLPIVSLIAILVGVILSFVGAVQLQLFGAEIYIANLVTLGMVMEMGALMSGVIISGRIGAAYAAQLGTMQTNEEIDALRTMGISPMGFLVLPRLLALMLMMPLLCIYADIMGILGGMLIGQVMLGLSPVEFMHQAVKSLKLYYCVQGLAKSAAFGVLIGFAGCLRGMECGRSAMAVGEATTSAVVTSIVFIVISDSILTILFNVIWR